MREIPGDPLTGSVPALPRTQMYITPKQLGPAKRHFVERRRDQWPYVADPEAISYERMRPGSIASVRTRRGVRTWQVRLVGLTAKGKRFFVGMDRKGWCHSAMLGQVISVDTLQRHLARSRVIDVRVRREAL
jgi:hypothetical protein